MTIYKILILGKVDKIFTYTCSSYEKKDGFIEFFDKNNMFHSFPLTILQGVIQSEE